MIAFSLSLGTLTEFSQPLLQVERVRASTRAKATIITKLAMVLL